MLRISALVLVLLLLAAPLGGCAAKNRTALTIEEIPIDREVFIYYYDYVRAHAEDFELYASSPHKFFAEKAQLLCARYLHVNSMFDQQGKALTIQEKAAISEKVNKRWRVFSAHYTGIGVTKQTLTKIESSQAFRDRLFFDRYGSGGDKAVAEKDIQAYFSQNYVVCKVIPGYFTQMNEKGEQKKLSQSEISALRNQFAKMLQDLGDGKSMDQVNDSYLDTVNSLVPQTILQRGSQTYTESFFADVQKLQPNVPKILEYAKDNYIFLVERESVDYKNDAAYLENRDSCLKQLKEPEFLQELNAKADEYKIVRNEKEIAQVMAMP